MIKLIFIIFYLTIQALNASVLTTDNTALSFGLGSGGTSYIQGAAGVLINPANTFSEKNFDIIFSQFFGPASIDMSFLALKNH